MSIKSQKFHEFVTLLPLSVNEKEAREWGKNLPRPAFICGKEVKDDDINLLSFGNYMLLAGAKDDKSLVQIIQAIFDVDLYNEEAYISIGYIHWIAQSIAKINKLFAKQHIPPTDEERQAGVDKLNFGIFGLVDWYARRMNINHDEVEKTAWIRIYKCLEMDTRQILFDRRLSNVRLAKQKAKSKGRRKR